MHAIDMLRTRREQPQAPVDALGRSIEECFACAQTCTACADACLDEEQAETLRRCIRLNLDCADLCVVTGMVLSRQTAPEWSILRRQVEVMAEICRACGDECSRHAQHHKHCRVCAEACHRCAESCEELLRTL